MGETCFSRPTAPYHLIQSTRTKISEKAKRLKLCLLIDIHWLVFMVISSPCRSSSDELLRSFGHADLAVSREAIFNQNLHIAVINLSEYELLTRSILCNEFQYSYSMLYFLVLKWRINV